MGIHGSCWAKRERGHSKLVVKLILWKTTDAEQEKHRGKRAEMKSKLDMGGVTTLGYYCLKYIRVCFCYWSQTRWALRILKWMQLRQTAELHRLSGLWCLRLLGTKTQAQKRITGTERAGGLWQKTVRRPRLEFSPADNSLWSGTFKTQKVNVWKSNKNSDNGRNNKRSGKAVSVATVAFHRSSAEQ